MTYKESIAKIEADTNRLRAVRLEFEAAMRVFNPDINRSSIEPYPHIDADRLRGPSDWDREQQESRRLNR
jgi:hypothetical protein